MSTALGGTNLSTARVLVVDDEAMVRNFTVQLLMLMGAGAEAAANGEGAEQAYARARAEGRPFTVVILDLNLGAGGDGSAVLARLRQMDSQVKAVVSTGDLHDPAVAQSRSLGFCGTLPKPYRLEELVAAVRAAMAGSPVSASAG